MNNYIMDKPDNKEEIAKLPSLKSIFMNLQELNALNKENDFTLSRLSLMKPILIALTIGGSLIIGLWQLFDRFYAFNGAGDLFWLRMLTIGIYIQNLIIALYRNNRIAFKQHLVAGFYFGTLYCTILAVETGGSQSPYWFGLFFILIAWFVLMSLSYRELIAHGILFILIFISGIYFQPLFENETGGLLKILFLNLGCLLVGSYAAVSKNWLDAVNYKSNFQLKTSNAEMITANEELKAEIENHYQTSQKLIEQQQFVDNIITNAPIVIWSMDLDGIFTYSHGKGLEKIGVSPNQNIGKSVVDVYKGTEAEVFIKNVLNGETLADIIKIGTIYYDTRVSPLFGMDGVKIGYMGVSMDITERIKTEDELRKFRMVIDQAPGAVFIIGKDSRFEYINPEFTRISGYTEDDLLNKNLSDTLYKGSIPESRKEIIETIASGKKWQGELLSVNKDGSTYWANTIAAPYKTSGGEIDGFIVIQQDITVRKQMELALQEKENLYRTLIEKSQDGVAISQDNKILLSNQAFCDIMGYGMQELLQTSPESLLAPEDKEMVLERYNKRLGGEASSHRYSAKFLHKSGKTIVLDLNAATVPINGKNASFVTIREITEKHKMEEALRASEDKYRKLFEAEMDAIFLIDTEVGQILEANPAASKIYGYSHEELITMKNTDLSAEPEQTSIAVKQKKSLVPIRRHRKKDGTIFTVELSAGFAVYEGRNVQIVTVRDISERLEMQKALMESEQKYKTLVENSQDAIIIVKNNKILFANHTYCNMIGYTIEDLHQFKASDFIHPDDRHKAIQLSEQRMAGDVSTIQQNFRIINRHNDTFECETFSSMIDFEGGPASFFTIHNITDNLKMQKALRESEEKYRLLVENSQDGIAIAQDGKFRFVNQAMCKMLGYTASEIYATDGHEFLSPRDKDKIMKIHQDRMNSKLVSTNYNMELLAKDGSIVEVEAQSSTFNFEGKPAGFYTLHNITHRKKIQAALRESEEKYRNLIEQATDGILITQNEVFKFVNKAFCSMMQYAEAELIDMPFLNVVHPRHHQEMIENHRRRMKGEKFPAIYRAEIIRKDGSPIIVELNSRTTEFDGIPASFVITRDITERLNIETELRNAKDDLEKLNKNLEERINISSQKLAEASTQLISLQKANLQSQFEVLRQQVNPHFLFNSLNVLTSLIKLEPDLAEKFTEHLSKVYRYVLENKDNDLVELKTELEFLDAYIFLLNIRFMDKIQVSIDAGDETKKFKILPLALQLLIENAIKHNSMSRKAPLKIRIFVDDEKILNVVNNLQTRESHMVSTGVGLRNIEHRYKLLEMPAPLFIKTDVEFIAKIPLKI